MNEITLDATLDNLRIAAAFVDERLDEMSCPMRAQTQIAIALDELLSNIVNYAYTPGVGPFTLRVEQAEDPPGAILTITDNGVPYDPLAREAPDVSLSAEERDIGGLGIFLVRGIMDQMTYRREDGKNVLRIRKNF